MSDHSVQILLNNGIAVDNLPPKQIFEPAYYQENGKEKSTLLVKDDDPRVKITIEDNSDDIYLKFEPLISREVKNDISISQSSDITTIGESTASYNAYSLPVTSEGIPLISVNESPYANGTKNPFTCPICKYEAAGGCSFQLHIMIHGRRKYYECTDENCGYSASSIDDLVKHIFKIHTTTAYYSYSDYKAEQIKRDTEYVPITNYEWKSDGQVNKSRLSKKQYECNNCSYTTMTEGYFQRHLKTHVKINSKSKNS